jgi:molybdopterin-guanine dinucleotide biosynthesis protein A
MTSPLGIAPLVGGLLVGGASRRFGSDKALARFEGRTLAERVASALAAVTEEVTLLGGGPVPPALAGLVRLDDDPRVRGPLAGLLAAFAAHPDRAWLVAACDQPWLDAAALAWLVAERRPGAVAVLPRLDSGGVEPFPGIYEPGAGTVLAGLACTGGSLQPLAARADVATPLVPSRHARAFADVDVPGDLG